MNNEFKGTKGKWLVDEKLVFANDYFQTHICQMSIAYNDEINKANALLISKAPQMLEMLKRVLEVNKHHNFNGHLINNEIEQLINEATTI